MFTVPSSHFLFIFADYDDIRKEADMMNMNRGRRRRLIIAGITAAGVAVAGTGFTRAAGTFARNRSVGEEQARNFSYIDAEVEPEDVIFSSAEFEWKNGSYIYEVDFRTGSASYEYEVRASDGTIIARSMELLETGADTAGGVAAGDGRKGAAAGAGDGTGGKAADTGDGNGEKAPAGKKSAGTAAGDKENGITAPDKQEAGRDTAGDGEKGTADGSRYIPVDRAKEAALKHAGLAAKDVTFTETKLETEDRRQVYSIEFYSASTEYEYSIDALTGGIIESSSEPWPDDGSAGAAAPADGTADPAESGGTEVDRSTQNVNNRDSGRKNSRTEAAQSGSDGNGGYDDDRYDDDEADDDRYDDDGAGDDDNYDDDDGYDDDRYDDSYDDDGGHDDEDDDDD